MSYQHESRGVFTPNEIDQMQEAFARSWRALRLTFKDPSCQQALNIREALAKLIVNFAFYGVKDPVELSERALGNLLPYASKWDQAA